MKNNKRKIDKKIVTQSKSNEIDREKSSIRKFHHILSISLILIISIAIYSNTLKNDFVFDDEDTIVSNTLIKGFNNLSKLWTKEYFKSSAELSYRPLVTLTYFIDYAIYGLKPWGYHLTNLLLHAMNGVLLYIFLVLFLSPAGRGRGEGAISLQLIISLLFITHPVLTEAVNAISFREDLLCFFFYMSTLSIYLLLKTKSNVTLNLFQGQGSNMRVYLLYALSCLFYLLALLSKEMAITFPLIIYLCEWIYNSPAIKGVRGLFNRYNIGYIAVTIFYLYLRFYLFHNPYEEVVQTLTLSERLMILPYLILKYIMLLIAPVSLSADYVITPVQSFISLKFIIPFIIVSVLVSVSVNSARTSKTQSQVTSYQLPVSIFGILFFLLTLIPVYNTIPIASPFAERYLYLPMVGFAITIGLIIHEIFAVKTTSPHRGEGWGEGWFFKRQNLYILTVSTVILSIYSFTVIQRNKIWRDSYSLWSDTVAKMPESSGAHNGLGNVYRKQGRLDEAIKEYLTALKIKPDYAGVRNNLGLVYKDQGKLDNAIREYRMALSLKHDLLPDVHNNIGDVYYKQGQLNEAINEFLAAIKFNPDLPIAHYNLGNVYAKLGQIDEAIKEYKLALTLNPDDAEAHNNLGKAYEKLGRIDDAIKEYMAALKLKSDLLLTHSNLGNIYVKQSRLDEAIKEYLTALKIKPDDAEIHNNLGLAYAIQGHLDEAIHEFQITLKLKPDHANARFNLGLAYKEKERGLKAESTE